MPAPPCAFVCPIPGVTPGAQAPLLPLGHTENAERERKESVSSSQQALPKEPLEHRRCFRAQQRPPEGGEGWQTALCVLHGPHSWEQGKRGKATPPEPAEPSVHFPVCSLFQT